MFALQQCITVAYFARPQGAELALLALLMRGVAPTKISALARDRRGDGAAAERFLALAADGVLGRRVGLGVLAQAEGSPIVVAGALATRLRATRSQRRDPLGAAFATFGLSPAAIDDCRAAMRGGDQLLMIESPDRVKLPEQLIRLGAVRVRTFAPRPAAPSEPRHERDVAASVAGHA